MKTPEIGSHVNGIGKLIHRQDGVFIFERTAARAEIRLAGEILQVIQTLDDRHGRLSGMHGQIAGMKAFCAKRKIGNKHALEVVVILTREYVTALEINNSTGYDGRYSDFKRVFVRLDPEEYPTEETIVWSSRTGNRRRRTQNTNLPTVWLNREQAELFPFGRRIPTQAELKRFLQSASE